MQIITAPETYTPNPGDITCFLAGGITNCYEWQKEVIETLKSYDSNGIEVDHLIIFNPRREVFDTSDPRQTEEQIEWEFYALENCDIFSMYFCESEKSVLPICLYELGRNIVRMQQRHPMSWRDRLVISVEDEYIRKNDVFIQTKLAVDKDIISMGGDVTPQSHAKNILMAYTWIKEDL